MPEEQTERDADQLHRYNILAWDMNKGRPDGEIELVVYASNEDQAILKASELAVREYYELSGAEEIYPLFSSDGSFEVGAPGEEPT